MSIRPIFSRKSLYLIVMNSILIATNYFLIAVTSITLLTLIF